MAMPMVMGQSAPRLDDPCGFPPDGTQEAADEFRSLGVVHLLELDVHLANAVERRQSVLDPSGQLGTVGPDVHRKKEPDRDMSASRLHTTDHPDLVDAPPERRVLHGSNRRPHLNLVQSHHCPLGIGSGHDQDFSRSIPVD
jgi:hypothetical protein